MIGVRNTVLRLILQALWIQLLILCFYLQEQIFYELLIQRRISYFREYEIWFIAFAYATLCGILPVGIILYSSQRSMRILVVFSTWLGPWLIILLFSFSNIGWYAAEPLGVSQSSTNRYDAIAVFNKGNARFRLRFGASRFRESSASRIILFVPKTTEFIDFVFRDLDLDPSSVVFARPDSAVNTYTECLQLKRIIETERLGTIGVVSDRYHLARIFLCLSASDINGVAPVVIPIDYYLEHPLEWLRPLGSSNSTSFEDLPYQTKLRFRHELLIEILHEYLGILFYKLIGYI